MYGFPGFKSVPAGFGAHGNLYSIDMDPANPVY
jgi:hypothetical protein